MKTCLAILAHQNAAATIAEFQPHWQKLGLPILAFLPEGDQWPGAPVAAVFQQGASAHRGPLGYDRFIRMAETLLTTDYEVFCMMEYDTLNLTASLPNFHAGRVNCGFMKVIEPEQMELLGRPEYYLALSPWIMSKPVLAALLPFLKQPVTNPKHLKWIDGLLDRWLAIVLLNQSAVKFANMRQCFSWPCNDPQAHDKIRALDITWVHGWKHKHQFRHLWPNL